MPYNLSFLKKARIFTRTKSTSRPLDARALVGRMNDAQNLSRSAPFEPVENYREPDFVSLSLAPPPAQTDRFQRLIETILLVTFAVLATMYFF